MRQLGILLISIAAGCSSSDPGYGPATATTVIHLEEGGGLPVEGQPEISTVIDIVGTSVSYNNLGMTGQATIELSSVGTIIDALESVGFLDLDSDALANCVPTAADMPFRNIHVVLSGGTKDLHHNMNCTGGSFAELLQMEQQIFVSSGFNRWVAST